MAAPYLKRAAAIVGNWKNAEIAKQKEKEELSKSVPVDTSKQPTKEDIESGISPYVAMNLRLQGKSEKIKDLVPKKPASSPFWAGVGDVIKTAGSALSFLGAKKEGIGVFDKTGKKMQEYGNTLQNEFNEPEKIAALGDFNWSDMTQPEFYSQKVLRSVPFSLSLIPAGIVGAYAGAATAGAIGLGAFGTTVLGSIGAAALSRPIESALEAGSSYQEALDKGLSQEQANSAANSVFRRNLSLAGMDATEFAAAFLPTKKIPFLNSSKFLRTGIGKAVTTGTKLLTTGAMEATEEILQEKFQREAAGEKFDINAPATKEAGVVGALFGVAMGGAGDAFTNLQRGVIESLPEKAKTAYDKFLNKELNKGVPEQQATIKALDKIAITHKNDVQEAINVRIEEIKKEPIAQKEPIKIEPALKPIAPKEEIKNEEFTLIQEATKYKSAEEFVNSDFARNKYAELNKEADNLVIRKKQLSELTAIESTPKATRENSRLLNEVKNIDKRISQIGKEKTNLDSQLTDIWNKANEKISEENISSEALKVVENGGTNEKFRDFSNVKIRTVPESQIENEEISSYKITEDGGIEILVSDKLGESEIKQVATRELENAISEKTNKNITQKEKVAQAIKEKPKSIKEVSKLTGILEPNVRRILGVGTKEGVFDRVDKGVYIIKKNGEDIAFVHTGDALEILPGLVKDGFKADMVFLDIPYNAAGNRGGNRMNEKKGTIFNTITPDQFGTFIDSVSKALKTENSPLVYMFSQSKTSEKTMKAYTDKILEKGFVPLAKGDYYKMSKGGKRLTKPMRPEPLDPEGIIIFNKTGKFDFKGLGKTIPELQYKLTRPKGWQTEKPAQLLKSLIELTTDEGEVVLDPFAGSGVTAEQAVKYGRKTVAIEKNKEAVEKFIKPRVKKAAEEKQLKLAKETKPQKVATEVKKEKTTKVSQKKFPKYADAGGFADYPINNSDIKNGGISDFEFNKQKEISDITKKLKGIEMPELVKMYSELTNSAKLLLKNYPSYLGRFYAIQTNYHIGLNRKLFARQTIEDADGTQRLETDSELHDRAAKTMAHELGHLTDFLPDEIMNRGNILGRLLTLSNFRKEIVGNQDLLDKRQKLLQQIGNRKRQIKKGQTEIIKIQNGKKVKVNIKEDLSRIEKELSELSKKLVFKKDFQKELKELTQKWKPFDETKVPEWFKNYRYSSPELYADFISVLFTRPDLAKEWSPKFLDFWFKNIDKKPEFKKTFFELQMIIGGEREHLVQQRYDDLLAMFKRSDEIFKQQLIERVSHKNNPWYQFKKQMVYQHQWATDKYNKNKELFRNNPDSDPRFFMEQYDYLGEKIYAKINKNISPIITELKDADLSWEQLSAVLFVERIGKGDSREGVANPLGHTIQSANELRNHIFNMIDNKEKAEVLFNSAKKLRKALKYLMIDYDFLYTPEMLETLKKDDYYAPFNIAYKVFNKLPAGMKHQTGNLNDTNNIANNIILKYIGIIHSGEKSKISGKVVDMVKKFDGGVKEAEYYVSGKKTIMVNGKKEVIITRTPKEPEDLNLGLITTMEGGKLKGYYVPKEIADSFKYEPLAEQNLLIKYVFEIPNKYFFKPLFTTINPGFQAVNFLFRDSMTTKKLPGMNWKNLFKYYKESLPLAYKKAWGKYDETINRMLDRGILIMNNSGKYKFSESVEARDKEGIDYILQMAGFDRFKDENKYSKIPLLKQAKTVIDFMQNVGEMFEATPKIAGYKYLLDNKIFANEKITEHWVRSNIGSPNFKKISNQHFVLNNIGLFYNAIIRGWERSAETATYKDSRSAFWFHIVKYSIIPVILSVAAEEGLFGEELKKMHRKMSEYMKNNYINIPIKISKKLSPNKLVFISFPMAEEDRLFHAVTRMALRGIIDRNISLSRSALDIASYTGGQVPGFAPQVEMGLGWYTYLTGGNPYDMFRGQSVFTMDEERTGAKIKIPIMLKWTLNKMGILKSELHDRPQNTSLGESTIKNTPILNRFLRISNFGEYEASQRPKEAEGIKEATETIIEKKKIIEAVNNYWKEKPENIQSYINKTAVEVYGNKISKTDYNNLKKKFNNYLVGGLNDANLNSLSNGTTRQKVAVLINLKDNLSNDDFNKLLQTAINTKTLSEDVIKEFSQKLKEINAANSF